MYYFIGIKGSGMSALAQFMKRLGFDVKGSDVKNHFFTEKGLNDLNIEVLEYNKNNIKDDMIIVKGESIDDDNEEVKKAKELNLKIYSYTDMLGELTKKYNTITVAGCHGKTTTTSLMSHVFSNLKGCNYLIGDGSGYADKNSNYFILEACEYKRHFLNYDKDIAVITNIDLDHVDYYKDINDVIDAYQSYIDNTKKFVIVCAEDPYTKYLKSDKIKYYGLSSKYDIYADNIKYSEGGCEFDVYIDNSFYGHFNIPIYGKEILLDVLAVIASSHYMGINAINLNKSLSEFKGANRRFEETKVNENVVIDDYAHHPNEIKALFNSIKQKYPNKKIIGIFQPHTYSRTKKFTDDFVNIFKDIYKVYILDIHPAREKKEDYKDVDSYNIINKLSNGYYLDINNMDNIVEDGEYIYVIMSPNDLSIIKDNIVKKLENKDKAKIYKKI